MNEVIELFGLPAKEDADWDNIVAGQECPYTLKRCFKVRKSAPEISIGTCAVSYGAQSMPLIICPNRLLEGSQVFLDAIHLLTAHEPGNQIHAVPEFAVPGGSVDYMLASVRGGRVRDFVGIEFQTLDTTGTVWPARQQALKLHGISVPQTETASGKTFGINWKMTAKTTLVQMHHKVSTFEAINKRLLLVIQDKLFDYLAKEFSTEALDKPIISNTFHVHVYALKPYQNGMTLDLSERFSTNAQGVAMLLGMKQSGDVTLATLHKQIEDKLSDSTLVRLPNSRLNRRR